MLCIEWNILAEIWMGKRESECLIVGKLHDAVSDIATC